MTSMRAVLVYFAIHTATLAIGGSWSSSGGDILKDRFNAWFIENTTSVAYCLMIDERSMSLGATRIEQLVDEAIAYWQREFAQSYADKWRPATQTFHRVSCRQNPDISFQFGVLNKLQRKFLGDSRRHIGVTVRTDYDLSQLRARGFIYISPDRGPDSFIDPATMSEDLWSLADGHLLYLTLLHELGHVFGIQHQGNFWHLMSAGFVENIVREPMTSTVATYRYEPDFFSFRQFDHTQRHCRGSPFLHRDTLDFWGLPDEGKCLKVELTIDGLEVFYRLDDDADSSEGWILLGSASFTSQNLSAIEMVQTLYIDVEQQGVFTDPVPESGRLQGPAKVYFRKFGSYRTIAGDLKREVFVNFRETGPTIGGTFDNRSIPDLFPLPASIISD